MTHFVERLSMSQILSKLRRRQRRTTNPDKPLTEDHDIPHQSDHPSLRPKKTWLSPFRESLDKLRSWRKHPPFRRRRSSQPPVQALISSPRHTIALPTIDEMQEGEDEVISEERVEVTREESCPERELDVAIDPLQESVSLTRSSSLVLLPDLLTFSFSSSELSLGSLISSSRPGTPVSSVENLGRSSLNPNSTGDLPTEILDVIFNLVLESELCATRGNHVLLRNIRHVCRRWKVLGEEILWRSLRTSGGLFTKDQHSDDPDDLFCRRKLRTDLREWYAQGSRRLRSFGTVSATSDVVENIQDLDTGYLRTVFGGLARCSRADIKILVERATSSDNIQPDTALPATPNREEDHPWTLNLSHLSPCVWPFLVDLSLMCPLSVEDAYFALVGGCNTLKRVSIGTIKANTNLRDTALVSSSPSIPASRVTLGSLEWLSIQAYSDTSNLFTKFNFPKLTNCLLSIPSRSTTSLLLGDPASVSGSSQYPALLIDLEHLWGGLTTFSLDTEEVLQRADLVDIFLKCDKLTNLTWKGRSTSSAPRHISSLDNARLDSFWRRLTHLSLESEDRDAWPLAEAVKKCDALESLEWKGLQSGLSESLTSRSLENLTELVVDLDEEAFSTLFQMATSLSKVTAPSALCVSSRWPDDIPVKSVTIKDIITTCEAARILKRLRSYPNIVHADLCIHHKATLDDHMLSNTSLRHLTLRLPFIDRCSFAPLIKCISIQRLQQIDLFLPERVFDVTILEALLHESGKSFKEIYSIPNTPGLSKTMFFSIII